MTSISSTTSSGFFTDLFATLPDSNTSDNADVLDHIAAYADTAQGSWDVFRAIENLVTWAQKLPSISEAGSSLLGRVSEVVNTAGIGLSIPAIIIDCNNLRSSVYNLFSVQDLPYSDPLRARKITQAFKKSFLDAMSLTNNTTQAALFADRVKVLTFEAAHLSIVDGVYNATSAIMDGAELVGEYFKLKFYHSPEAQPRNDAEQSKLEERKRLSWMIIAKDVASIGSAGIALVGIVFGIATQSMAAVAAAGLILGTVWLTMKITSYFYNKIVVEAPLRAR